jgi:hypothetical protein
MSDYNRDLTDDQLQILCILVQYILADDDAEMKVGEALEKVRVGMGLTAEQIPHVRRVTGRYVTSKLTRSAR